jgi:transposase InsO family protein
MIRQILHQLDTFKEQSQTSWRELCDGLPYSSVMRWRKRQASGSPLWQAPGPKKPATINGAQLYPLLCLLRHGRRRTQGTGPLYQCLSCCLSRRQLGALVQDYRRDLLDSMKHIHWLWAGLAWSFDATEYGEDGCQIIPVQDLASRYRFQPLVSSKLDGRQIAAHLESLFRRHGAPLLLKRDNGSPFNNQHVDEVMARFGVLPLNNPPHFPRYNGAMEKGIRDFKTALAKRQLPAANAPAALALTVACTAFHDPTQRLRWTKRQRQTIFRLLFQRFADMIGNTANENHPSPATLWRVNVESWLRCQGLIVIRQNKKVSTNFPKIWSHN